MKMKTINAVVAIFSFVALAAPAAHAVPIDITGLFNTGLDAGGALLGDNVDDPHYAIIEQPEPGGLSDQTIRADEFPIPPCIANSATSRWIGSNGNGDGSGPPGFFTYRTTFEIPVGADLASVIIGGSWAADDVGTDIIINGASTLPAVLPSLAALVGFSVTSDFIIGLNTLDFRLLNSEFTGNNPTGLRVEGISGTFALTQISEPGEPGQQVPEPGTLALIGIGLLGIGLARRRKNSLPPSAAIA